MADWDFILAPSTIAVEIQLNEVATLLNSLKMVNAEDFHSGLHEWIPRTAQAMSKERLRMNMHAINYLEHIQADANASSFPEFIQAIKKADIRIIHDYAFHWLREKADYPGDAALLANREAYIDFVAKSLKEHKDEDCDREFWGEEWEFISQEDYALSAILEHAQFMWEHYLKAEWRRVRPLIEDAVEAFNSLDYSNMSAHEAIETVTGRNMRGRDFMEEKLARAEKLIFIPNAHLGPYISWGPSHEETTLIFYFGARPPKNAPVKSTALSRSELLVRLNALADETRLKMIELLTQHEELCAQDFINQLDLSQSSASRHLRQLTASGYLTERRRDVAKCYTINPERIEDTIRALKEFLRKN